MARAADTDDVDGSCFVTKSPAGDQVDALCVSSSTASCLPGLPLHRPPPKDLRQVNCSAGPIHSTFCSDLSTRNHAQPDQTPRGRWRQPSNEQKRQPRRGEKPQEKKKKKGKETETERENSAVSTPSTLACYLISSPD